MWDFLKIRWQNVHNFKSLSDKMYKFINGHKIHKNMNDLWQKVQLTLWLSNTRHN